MIVTAGCGTVPVAPAVGSPATMTHDSSVPLPTPSASCITFATDIYFEPQRTDLTARAQARLADLVSRLPKIEIEAILVDGHADSSEAPAYAEILSEQRAEAVKAYLVANGVPDTSIHTKAHGSKQPLAVESIDGQVSLEGRERNRVAEVEVIPRRRPRPPPIPGAPPRPVC